VHESHHCPLEKDVLVRGDVEIGLGPVREDLSADHDDRLVSVPQANTLHVNFSK
jgi:hypothetical protein